MNWRCALKNKLLLLEMLLLEMLLLEMLLIELLLIELLLLEWHGVQPTAFFMAAALNGARQFADLSESLAMVRKRRSYLQVTVAAWRAAGVAFLPIGEMGRDLPILLSFLFL